MTRSLVLVVALAAPATAQSGQGLPFPVVDATNNRLVFLESFDGAVSTWIAPIDLAQHGVIDPVHAVTVGMMEVWVSDRTTDSIYRLLLFSGTLNGVISTGLDDVRGMLSTYNRVFVVNRGSGNGAPGPSIVTFDLSANNLGSFPVTDPSSVYGGGVLMVGNLAGHDLDLYSLAGTFLGKFHDSDGVTGIDEPMQMNGLGCRGPLLCAGAGATPGIYAYDAAGAQVAHLPTASGVRGVYALRNGNWLFSDANGVHVRDFATGTTIDVLPGIDAWFFGDSIVELPISHAYCYGSQSSCPCGNNPPVFCVEGCVNSLGVGAMLQAGGRSSISADTTGLHARQLPATASVLFFQGLTLHNNGQGSSFGDGLRCVGGSTIRLGIKHAVNGIASYPESGDLPISVRGQVTTPGERTYQCWYRNAASFCTPATFNLTNGWRLFWEP